MPQKSKLDLPPIDLGKESIGERIARLRKERGFSQKELADKMGLIQQLVSLFERDERKLNAEMAARFAKVLSVSCDEIIGLDSNGKEKYVPNLKMVKRLKDIEQLSDYNQKILLKMIDSFIRDNLPKDE